MYRVIWIGTHKKTNYDKLYLAKQAISSQFTGDIEFVKHSNVGGYQFILAKYYFRAVAIITPVVD